MMESKPQSENFEKIKNMFKEFEEKAETIYKDL